MMMGIVSDSDTESDFSVNPGQKELDKRILSYLHLTEMDQFKAKYIDKYSHTNSFFKNFMEGNLIKTIDYIEDVDEEVNATNSNLEVKHYSSENLWLKITDKLNLYAQTDDIGQTILSYSGLLKLHIRNGISLNVRCFDSLLLCDTPYYIKALFDLNLIEPEDKAYISHLFDTDSKLLDPAYVHKLVRSDHFVNIVASLTILFYKYPISKTGVEDVDNSSIVDCLVTIAGVMNTEKHVDHYNRNTLEDNFNRLVKAAYLNGLFTNHELSSFLENNRPCNDPSLHSSDDSNSFLESSDDSMDTEDEFSDDDVRPRRRLEFNGQQRNNIQKKSIGERIKFKENLAEPQSLKKLARVQIKNSMKDYCLKNVKKLELPQILKDYVAFNEEVSEVLMKQDRKITVVL